MLTASHKIGIDVRIFKDLLGVAVEGKGSVSRLMNPGEDMAGSYSSKRSFMLDPRALEYAFRLNQVLCKARLLA